MAQGRKVESRKNIGGGKSLTFRIRILEMLSGSMFKNLKGREATYFEAIKQTDETQDS